MNFHIYVFDGACSASFALTLSVLNTAAVVARRLEVTPPSWRVVSARGGDVHLNNDITVKSSQIDSDFSFSHCLIIIDRQDASSSDLLETSDTATDTDVELLRSTIENHVQKGGRVVASGASVSLLSPVNVWNVQLSPTSRRIHSQQKAPPSLYVNNIKVFSIDEYTAASLGGVAHAKLLVRLLRINYGSVLARMVTRMLFLDESDTYTIDAMSDIYTVEDEVVLQFIKKIDDLLPDIPKIGVLAADLKFSERSLSRRIHKSTGKSTMALIQIIRIDRAKELLMDTKLSVHAVAAAVGYKDSTALWRIVKRFTGGTTWNLKRQLDEVV